MMKNFRMSGIIKSELYFTYDIDVQKMRQLTDHFNMILKEFIIVPHILKQVLVLELSGTL